MKKILILSLTLILVLTFSLPVFASTNSISENETISSKDMLNILENEMNKAGVGKGKDSRNKSQEPITVQSTAQVNIGTNKTFTWGNAANDGHSGSAFGQYGTGWGFAYEPGWADAGVNAAIIGSCGAWSWVGQQIYVAGSSGQTRQARISFNGSYKGQLQTVLISSGSSASGTVRVSVFDIGTSTDKGGTTVFNKTVAGYEPIYQGPIDHNVTLTLEAGHTYALRFGVSTAVNCKKYDDVASAQFCDADWSGSWTPQPGGFGLTYNSISITWL